MNEEKEVYFDQYCKSCNNTRSIVEEILEMIRTKLAEVENAEN